MKKGNQGKGGGRPVGWRKIADLSDHENFEYGVVEVAAKLGMSKQAVNNVTRYAIRKLWRQSLMLSRIKDRFEAEGLV